MEIKQTVASLARALTEAVAAGWGHIEVDGVLHTVAPIAWEQEPPLEPVEVRRDKRGYWRHPGFPTFWAVPMSTWLRQRGFDFTVTYLIEPDGFTLDADKNIAACELRRPAASGDWFCFEININADGSPVAVWIAPTK